MVLSGPDLNNGLLCVLIRFRLDPVAFMADIIYRWREAQGPPISSGMKTITQQSSWQTIEFWKPKSPTGATYGRRKAAEVGDFGFWSDVKELVDKNLYVDDALKSVATLAKAIDLLERAWVMLAPANLRLHKIVSSHPKVT